MYSTLPLFDRPIKITPFEASIISGNQRTIERLVEATNPSIASSGLSFYYACALGNIDIVTYLLTITEQPMINIRTGFAVSCKLKRKAISELIFNYHSPDYIRDKHGNNALHIAIKYNYYDIIPTLISKNIDIYEKNNENLTPLQYAVQLGDDIIINLLKGYVNENSKKKVDEITHNNNNTNTSTITTTNNNNNNNQTNITNTNDSISILKSPTPATKRTATLPPIDNSLSPIISKNKNYQLPSLSLNNSERSKIKEEIVEEKTRQLEEEAIHQPIKEEPELINDESEKVKEEPELIQEETKTIDEENKSIQNESKPIDEDNERIKEETEPMIE